MCFNLAPHHEGVLGTGIIFLRILDLGTQMEVSGHLHSSTAFTPRKKDPGTHWIGGWVGPIASLENVAKRNISSLCRDSNPPIIQLVAQRYTTELPRPLLGNT
jgi:hypothetical protein